MQDPIDKQQQASGFYQLTLQTLTLQSKTHQVQPTSNNNPELEPPNQIEVGERLETLAHINSPQIKQEQTEISREQPNPKRNKRKGAKENIKKKQQTLVGVTLYHAASLLIGSVMPAIYFMFLYEDSTDGLSSLKDTLIVLASLQIAFVLFNISVMGLFLAKCISRRALSIFEDVIMIGLLVYFLVELVVMSCMIDMLRDKPYEGLLKDADNSRIGLGAQILLQFLVSALYLKFWKAKYLSE